MQDQRLENPGEADDVVLAVEPRCEDTGGSRRHSITILVALAFVSGGAIAWSAAERTLGQLKAKLADAEVERTAADAVRTELVAEVASRRRAAEAAEQKAGALEAEIATKRVADERSVPAPAVTPVTPPKAEPAPVPEPQPKAVALASPESSENVLPGGHAASADASLAEGRRQLRSGNLQAARQLFERAASLGLPEGALAMGTTFDPFALSKAGIAETGAPDEAQRWYRRAYELSGTPAH